MNTLLLTTQGASETSAPLYTVSSLGTIRKHGPWFDEKTQTFKDFRVAYIEEMEPSEANFVQDLWGLQDQATPQFRYYGQIYLDVGCVETSMLFSVPGDLFAKTFQPKAWISMGYQVSSVDYGDKIHAELSFFNWFEHHAIDNTRVQTSTQNMLRVTKRLHRRFGFIL